MFKSDEPLQARSRINIGRASLPRVGLNVSNDPMTGSQLTFVLPPNNSDLMMTMTTNRHHSRHMYPVHRQSHDDELMMITCLLPFRPAYGRHGVPERPRAETGKEEDDDNTRFSTRESTSRSTQRPERKRKRLRLYLDHSDPHLGTEYYEKV